MLTCMPVSGKGSFEFDVVCFRSMQHLKLVYVGLTQYTRIYIIKSSIQASSMQTGRLVFEVLCYYGENLFNRVLSIAISAERLLEKDDS